MAGAHHDTHLVGQRAVQGVVVVECAVPHCRPHKVAFQTQDKLEKFLIEEMVEVTEGLGCPVAERRPLVVQEYTAVFHLGLAHGIYAGFH